MHLKEGEEGDLCVPQTNITSQQVCSSQATGGRISGLLPTNDTESSPAPQITTHQYTIQSGRPLLALQNM